MIMSVETMVRPAGLEPATYGLEGRCSIQLSYERINVCIKDVIHTLLYERDYIVRSLYCQGLWLFVGNYTKS